MILIAVVDDNYGMMFHNRRQSQDRVLRERVLKMIKNNYLWMNSYTKKQFTEAANTTQICVDEDFLEKTPLGGYCFVENSMVSSYENKIEKIFLFRWNRVYPSDFYFDIDLKGNGWNLISSDDFSGYSHDKITMEVYGK